MFTIGYGDITPTNTLETISCVGYILFSSIQLSYSISTVGAIINELTVHAEEVRVKLKVVNNFMHKHGIGANLQYEVRAYLDYFWHQD
jgi:Ion channel